MYLSIDSFPRRIDIREDIFYRGIDRTISTLLNVTNRAPTRGDPALGSRESRIENRDRPAEITPRKDERDHRYRTVFVFGIKSSIIGDKRNQRRRMRARRVTSPAVSMLRCKRERSTNDAEPLCIEIHVLCMPGNDFGSRSPFLSVLRRGTCTENPLELLILLWRGNDRK